MSEEAPCQFFLRNKSTRASPTTEPSGEREGHNPSNPASMPAQGRNAVSDKKTKTASAPLPNPAYTNPRYPPYFFPRERRKKQAQKKSTPENTSAGRKYCARKKATSSAPEKKPAPMTAPTINSAVLNSFIHSIYSDYSLFMQKQKIFCNYA